MSDLNPQEAKKAEENEKQSKKLEKKMLSPIVSISALAGLTIIYFVASAIIPKLRIVFMIIYGLSVILAQVLVNVKNSQYICGSVNATQGLLWAIIPILGILGLTIGAITVAPGLKKPFSNTFGYIIVLLLGVKKKFRKILPDYLNDSGSTGDETSLVNEVYNNPALLINEMTPNNFVYIIKRLSNIKLTKGEKLAAGKNVTRDRGILKEVYDRDFFNEYEKGENKDDDEAKNLNKIKTLVLIKDKVSEFIWILLAGILACTISYNSMLNINCDSKFEFGSELDEAILSSTGVDPCDNLEEEDCNKKPKCKFSDDKCFTVNCATFETSDKCDAEYCKWDDVERCQPK